MQARAAKMNHLNEPDKHRLAGNEGLALVTTILVMVLLTAGVAAMKTISANYQSSRTFYIAEAGAEAALGQIQLALQDGVITDDELSNITPPTLSGFEFNQFEVVKDGTLVTETITDGPFTGGQSQAAAARRNGSAEPSPTARPSATSSTGTTRSSSNAPKASGAASTCLPAARWSARSSAPRLEKRISRYAVGS